MLWHSFEWKKVNKRKTRVKICVLAYCNGKNYNVVFGTVKSTNQQTIILIFYKMLVNNSQVLTNRKFAYKISSK